MSEDPDANVEESAPGLPMNVEDGCSLNLHRLFTISSLVGSGIVGDLCYNAHDVHDGTPVA